MRGLYSYREEIQEIIHDELEPRVIAGSKFLDMNDSLWRENVNIDSLDMYDTSNCVLGQRYGSFTRGLHILDVYNIGEELGFSADDIMDEYEVEGALVYPILTNLWINELEEGI